MKDRRDRCMCGRIIAWDEDANKVTCKHCGTDYEVESDSVMVYWLREIVKDNVCRHCGNDIKPYKTDPKL